MRLIIILVVLLLPLTSAWELYNLEDFIGQAYESARCDEVVNISNLLIEENATEPSYSIMRSYTRNQTCENFVRAGYHFFQLTDPTPTCSRFYPTIHEWFNLSDWGFKAPDCGIDLKKSDLDALIYDFRSGFFSGDLQVDQFVLREESPLQEPPATTKDSTNETNTTLGIRGGSGSERLRDYIWASPLYMPNWVILEIIFIILSIWVPRTFFWNRKTYQRAEDKWGGPMRPEKKVFSSLGRRLTHFISAFIIFNAIFWIAFLFWP